MQLSENFLEGAAMDVDELAAEVGKMARFSAKDLYDSDGNLIPIHELHDDVAVNVNEIETENGKVTKVKAGKDKRAALDMIAKNRAWYEAHERAGKPEINITFLEGDDEL
jgi:hypothetical protein